MGWAVRRTLQHERVSAARPGRHQRSGRAHACRGWFLNGKSFIESEGISCDVVGERGEMLHSEEIYAFPCIRLVELIEANRKRTMTGKDWQPVRRMIVGETHHCTFIAAVCTGSLIANHPNDIRRRRHHLCDAVQTVVAMTTESHSQVSYYDIVHLHTVETLSRAGREVRPTVGCQGIVALPDPAFELGVATKPARTYCTFHAIS